jgi:uncharacterized membrane protein
VILLKNDVKIGDSLTRLPFLFLVMISFLKVYQVRDKRSLTRHFILVFCAYTFILWHQLTGGLRRRWASKPLNTFTEALEAFRTAMSYRFFVRVACALHIWLTYNRDVFAA